VSLSGKKESQWLKSEPSHPVLWTFRPQGRRPSDLAETFVLRVPCAYLLIRGQKRKQHENCVKAHGLLLGLVLHNSENRPNL
jgi:hypothetical protein